VKDATQPSGAGLPSGNCGKGACAVFFLAAAAYFIIALWKLRFPGLYYDEIPFANIALGCPSGDLSVHRRWGGIPVMIVPYYSALKGWLYYPVFKAFGVSAWTVRLPAVLFGAGAIALTCLYVRRFFGGAAALAALCLIAVDPSFVFSTRLDWAPSSLMMLFKAAFLLGLAEWIMRKRAAGLWLAGAAAAAGTFDKLNFIWIALAGAGALAIVYHKRLGEGLQRSRAASIALCVLPVPCALLGGYYVSLIHGRWVAARHFPQRLEDIARVALSTAGGCGPREFIFGCGLRQCTEYLLLLAAAFAAAFAARAVCKRALASARELGFMALFSVLLLAQIFITANAGGTQHLVLLTPTGLVILAALLAPAFEDSDISVARRRAARILASCALGLALFGALRVDAAYMRDMDSPPQNVNWDTASRELADYAASHPGKRYAAVDWGLSAPLVAHSQGKAVCRDLWQNFMGYAYSPDPQWLKRFGDEFMRQDVVFLMHAAGAHVPPARRETRDNFFAAAKLRGWRLEKLAGIQSSAGKPFIELYGAGLIQSGSAAAQRGVVRK